MTLRFSDGEEFDTSGPFRVIRRRDGLYVIGNNLLLPVRDHAEGRDIILSMEKQNIAMVNRSKEPQLKKIPEKIFKRR